MILYLYEHFLTITEKYSDYYMKSSYKYRVRIILENECCALEVIPAGFCLIRKVVGEVKLNCRSLAHAVVHVNRADALQNACVFVKKFHGVFLRLGFYSVRLSAFR